MNPTKIRNHIISLLVIAVGIWFIIGISESYYSETSLPGVSIDITNSINSLGTMFLYGIGALIIFMIILYIYAKTAKKPS